MVIKASSTGCEKLAQQKNLKGLWTGDFRKLTGLTLNVDATETWWVRLMMSLSRTMILQVYSPESAAEISWITWKSKCQSHGFVSQLKPVYLRQWWGQCEWKILNCARRKLYSLEKKHSARANAWVTGSSRCQFSNTGNWHCHDWAL